MMSSEKLHTPNGSWMGVRRGMGSLALLPLMVAFHGIACGNAETGTPPVEFCENGRPKQQPVIECTSSTTVRRTDECGEVMDETCNPGLACFHGRCLPSTADDDLTNPTDADNGVDLADTSLGRRCDRSADCGGGELCVEGACHRGCGSSADCADLTAFPVCDEAKGVCTARGAVCGNGVVEAGEACERSQFSGFPCTELGAHMIGGQVACSNDCRLNFDDCERFRNVCGNGVVEPGEQCDPYDGPQSR